MNKLLFLSSLLLFPFLSIAQFVEGFDDLDFTSNPEWTGDQSDFIVNADAMLQLMMPSADTSYLATEVSTADSVSWEFYYKLEIDGSSPSNSNNIRVFLNADNLNLKGSVNGYYIRIGTSGEDDAIELRRQDGLAHELILEGSPGSVAGNPSLARIRVVRNHDALWKLYADYSGGTDFIFEGEVMDDTYNAGNYFGLFCKYANNGAQGFFLDDIKVGPLFVDDTAPVLLNAEALDESSVDVFFNEALDLTSAEVISNYSIDNGISILDAMLDDSDPTLVHLITSPLSSETTYTLTVENIFDNAANNSGVQSATFDFFQLETANANDILINEIMFDPTPELGLPKAEYIELYNRSNKAFDLSTYTLTVKTTTQTLPFFILEPDDYVILALDTAEAVLSPYGKVLPLESFTTLTNTGANITIATLAGTIINHVDYFPELIRDSKKRDGGWSIELINPDSPCEDISSNWSVTTSLIGGTPGQENSIIDRKADDILPDLLRVFPDTVNVLRLHFSEKMDVLTAMDPSNYSISNSIDVLSASLVGPENTEILLSISPDLEEGIIYEVSVKSSLLDCFGNEFGMFDTQPVKLPEPIEPGDLVINEILFNPEVGGVDFVELYNNSKKVMNLGELFIANLLDPEDPDAWAINHNYLIFPDGYIVLTPTPVDIMDRYHVETPFALIQNTLPTFGDKEGNVMIYTPALLGVNKIDEFDYEESFHYDLLDDKEGVSLERIDPGAATQTSDNWHSASQTNGFATPTYKNSQFVGLNNTGSDIFNIETITFSPDGDGFQDVLIVEYKTDSPGFTSRIDIYDANGRLVRNLANNELLATEGLFKWDGLNDAGTKASIGIYILAIELFNPNGDAQQIKKTCVLAGLLE